MSDRIKAQLYYLFIFVIIFLGIYIRVLFFSYARPFWNDESALALNVIGRNFFELFLPLDLDQTAPPLFACLSKFFGYFIKQPELAFRFVPLLSSIISILVFFLLCKNFCHNKISNIFALILFTFNYQIVYYSQEFRQYSSDILIFMLILLSYFYFDIKSAKKASLIVLGCLLGVTLWVSYTSVFAVLALAIALTIKNFSDLKNIWKNYLYCFIPFCLFLLLFFALKQNLNNSFYLHIFWHDGFLNWNLSNLPKLINDNLHFYFVNFNNKFFVWLTLIIGSWVLIFRLKYKNYCLIVLSIIFAFLLSYLHIYPLYNRVSLYLSPLLFIVMAMALDLPFCETIKLKWVKNVLIIFLVFVSAFVLLHFCANYFHLLKIKILEKQFYIEATPQLLEIAKSKMKKDDYLYVSSLSSINYHFYRNFYNIDNVIVETFPAYDIEMYKKIFNKLQSGKTYYLMMTHSGDKILEFNNLVNFIQTQQDVEIISDDNYNLLIRFTKR